MITKIYNKDGELDRNFRAGDMVRHFKGGLYRIVKIATHTETKEQLVIYESLNDKRVWARPYEMFTSKVDKDKYPDATQEYRLEKVTIKGSKETTPCYCC